MTRLSGIVLAGGRSERFGSSKLAAPFGSTSVLRATIARLGTCVDEIVVVRPPEDADHGGLDLGVGTRVARDEQPFDGPLAGLLVGLEAASFDVAIAIGGDMPLVSPAVLRLLATRLGVLVDRRSDTLRPPAAVILKSRPLHPLPLAIRRVDALTAGRALLADGERSLRALVAALDPEVVPEAEWRALDPDADSLVDIDRPQDLVRALARERSARSS